MFYIWKTFEVGIWTHVISVCKKKSKCCLYKKIVLECCIKRVQQDIR